MDTQKFEIGLEDFICRLPALFPYLEWNADGTVTTHVATDAPNGSYGKVVDNIHMPSNVKLTNYVSIDGSEVPETYQWGNSNTIGISQPKEEVFAVSAASYLRKVLWYRYAKTDEEFLDAELVEEIPSYISDEDTAHIKIVKTGYDGVPIECLSEEYDYYEKIGYYNYYQKKDIILPCTTYSYRTIIECYYKYKDMVGENNSFISFVNKGIGKIVIDRYLLNLEDVETYPEVPEFIYLSQIRKTISEYETYREAHRFYQTHYVNQGKTSKALSAKSKKYIRMGGDNMTNWLYQMLQLSYDVANEYKCHSDNKDFPARFHANLMLNKTEAVQGIETVMDNEFEPGKRYYDGDLLTHEGRTYICILDKLENGGNNFKYILKTKLIDDEFVKGLFVLNGVETEYNLISPRNIAYVLQMPNGRDKEYIVYEGQYYLWDASDSIYKPIDVHEYCTGVWNDTTERYVFDTQHFVLLSDLNGEETEWNRQWYDYNNLDGYNYRFFENTGYIPSNHVYDYVCAGENIFGWDNDESVYLPAAPNHVTQDYFYTVTEKTNSKLRDLRVFRNYVNPFGVSEEPDLNEDWLYYYKVGKLTGLVVETDEVGNILNDDEHPYGVCYSLHAYANIINSITYNSDNNTITFDYVIGGHLLAEYDGQGSDSDGNTIYFYKNFTLDENALDGVRFTETYRCYGDAINSLGGDFTAYVNGDLNTMITHAYEKFPFTTVPVQTTDDVQVIEGVSTTFVPVENGLLHANTVREEWHAGLYHQPKIKNNVSVDRGNGASFERHIRLGEIRTMEDFEYYQNGGYFKVSEN